MCVQLDELLTRGRNFSCSLLDCCDLALCLCPIWELDYSCRVGLKSAAPDMFNLSGVLFWWVGFKHTKRMKPAQTERENLPACPEKNDLMLRDYNQAHSTPTPFNDMSDWWRGQNKEAFDIMQHNVELRLRWAPCACILATHDICCMKFEEKSDWW